MWKLFKKSTQIPNKAAGTLTLPVLSKAQNTRTSTVVLDSQKTCIANYPNHVNSKFVCHLMGGHIVHDRQLSPDETRVVAALREWVGSPQAIAALPRLPATLPKLMGLLRREDLSIPDLAEHLSHDPALLGELMRIANSSFYRTARPVASVADAVQMIGQTGMRQLVMRVAMGPVFGGQQGHFGKLASGPLWEQAERCANASAWLRRGEGDAFDAYLAGIVASTGLISVLRRLDREITSHEAPTTAEFYLEMHECGVRLSCAVAQHWEFPQRIVQAMHARELQSNVSLPDSFVSAVQRADHCAKLVVLHRLEAMDEVTTSEDAACVQEILHCFEKPVDSTILGDIE